MGLPDNRQPFFISSASFSFHFTETSKIIIIFANASLAKHLIMTTAEKVRALIAKSGLSQKAFSESVSIHPVSMSNYLKNDNFSMKSLKKIADAQGVSISSLLPTKRERKVAPAPLINGYIEYDGKIEAIRCIEDLERVWTLVSKNNNGVSKPSTEKSLGTSKERTGSTRKAGMKVEPSTPSAVFTAEQDYFPPVKKLWFETTDLSMYVVTNPKNPIREMHNVITALDGLQIDVDEYYNIPADKGVVFSSFAPDPKNRILGNHTDCIITFQGVEFYGFEQMFSSMKFTHHPEVLHDIMGAKSALDAKHRSHKHFKQYDAEHSTNHYRQFILCHLFKYLSVKEYRSRLRELRGKILVECPGGKKDHAEAYLDKKRNMLVGCNYSGRMTMLVRDMMLTLEEEALSKKEGELGRTLTPDEHEAVLQSVYDETRKKYEQEPLVIHDIQPVIDYIKSSGIPLKREPIKQRNGGIKALVIDFDSTLFDTSVDSPFRKDKRPKTPEEWEHVYSLIPKYILYDGWTDVFKWTKENNIKIGILSEAKREIIEKAVAHFNIPCDAIVGKQYQKKKPHPQYIEMMMDKLDASSENIVYVGDSLIDKEQAAMGGMRFLAALWDSKDADSLKGDEGALQSPKEIIRCFNKSNRINKDMKTIFYHGSSVLFDRFSLDHALEGDGKVKFGFGVYVTESYSSALKYAHTSKQGDGCYIYKVEVPVKEEDNYIAFGEPVKERILADTEKTLGVTIPEKAKEDGKEFRKFLAGHFSNPKKPTLEGEKQASQFLDSIGVELIVWPFAWKKDENGNYKGPFNHAVLNDKKVRIVSVDSLDKEDKLIETITK